MEEQNKKEEEISEEEKKRKLAERLRMLRLNTLPQNKSLLKAFGGKQRYRFTGGGKTKRS
jgi:hypothetical protein